MYLTQQFCVVSTVHLSCKNIQCKYLHVFLLLSFFCAMEIKVLAASELKYHFYWMTGRKCSDSDKSVQRTSVNQKKMTH